MARHRDVRNLDAEDFESDFDYGSSYSGKNNLLKIDTDKLLSRKPKFYLYVHDTQGYFKSKSKSNLRKLI